MELGEVQAIVDRLVDAEKKGNGQLEKIYGKNYVQINKQVARIRPHADEDYLPLELIYKRAPNATKEQIDYLLENWKNTTMPVFQELLTVIGRGFIDDNWRIEWPEGSEEFQQYCEVDFPEYGSTESLFKETFPPLKYVDANALIAVRPRGFYYVKDIDGNYLRDADGLPMLDDTRRVEPAIYFHMSDKVFIREEHFYLVVANEYSLVEYGNSKQKVKEGRVMYAYTPNEIFKIEQYGRKVDNTYRTFLYYAHNEGVVPCTELRGIPKNTMDGGLMQISPFRYATDLLDLALTNKNWLQLSVSSVVFPFKIMMADPCTFADDTGRCVDGKWIGLKSGMHEGTCKSCNGKGFLSPYSPLGTYLWERPEGGLNQGMSLPKPVEFVEAPTTGLEFVQKLVDKDTTAAKQILHLVNPNENTNGSQNKVATVAVMNDQGQISFVRYNVHQIFSVWEWALNRISYQRYENYDYVPTLIYPQTFDFRSESDIWEQIKIARESEAPVSIIHDLFKSLLNNIHSSSPEAAKVFDTITNADQLFALSDIALASRKASGTVENWQIVLHDSAVQLVNQLISDNPDYLELELAERVAALVALAKSSTFTPNITSPVDLILANNP